MMHSLNLSKSTNKIIVLAHAVFIAKLYKTCMNLRYIVIIKRILLVKLETDGGEVYIAWIGDANSHFTYQNREKSD